MTAGIASKHVDVTTVRTIDSVPQVLTPPASSITPPGMLSTSGVTVPVAVPSATGTAGVDLR